MSVAEQKPPTSRSPRRIPSTIRLAPSVVNEFCGCAGSLEPGLAANMGVAGLLFGTTEQELVSVERCKPFSDAGSFEDVSPKREYLDAALERLLAAAKVDPELASLQLVGWYSAHRIGDIAPLCDGEIEFHNRRFRRATDLALILKPQPHTGLSIEVYSRSSLRTSLSRQDFRSGSLRFDVEVCPVEPIEVTMRSTVDDDYYLKVFQVLDSLDRAERKENWKRIAPKWLRSRANGDVNTATGGPSHPLLPAMTATPSMLGLEPSRSTGNSPPVYSAASAESTTPTSPLFNNSISPRALVRPRAGRIKLPWIAAVVFLLAAGVIFAFYSRIPSALLPGSAPGRAVTASPPLGVEVVRHERSLLVRWNPRSPAVQSATQAILHVDDGSQHRTIHLDPSELTNGSVMYTPSSNFVTFRLEVLDNKGLTISESLGVGDGSNSAPIVPNPRPGALETAVTKTIQADPKSEGRSGRMAAGRVQTGTPSNSTLVAGKQALPPKTHPLTVGNAPALPVGLGGRSRPPAFTQMNSDSTEAKQLRHSPTEEGREPERPPSVAQRPAGLTSDSRSAGQPRVGAIDSRWNEPIERKTSENSPPAQPPKPSAQGARVKDFVKASASTYVPARPLKQVRPNTSTLDASRIHTSTAIEVEVRIDEAGRVTEAHVLNGGSDENNLFTSAALAAAREWIFQPATMNGKNVSSVHAIEFHFHPQVGQQ
jgi:TonB family protein